MNHHFTFLPHLVTSWILSYAENLASSSLQDEATKWLYYAVGTSHPTQPHYQLEIRSLSVFFQCFAMFPSRFFLPSTKYVWCPVPPPIILFLCSVPPLILGPSWFISLTCISECGTPSWACFSCLCSCWEAYWLQRKIISCKLQSILKSDCLSVCPFVARHHI